MSLPRLVKQSPRLNRQAKIRFFFEKKSAAKKINSDLGVSLGDIDARGIK